ncbi:alpha/beta hydrolase [Chitinimonas lacunae]|uniref:Alpha/beta hydrolase n=1 Tax=Chitinimonas lacunae TaxID=1963018 RepID=A0ABV8MVP5_9NEIS
MPHRALLAALLAAVLLGSRAGQAEPAAAIASADQVMPYVLDNTEVRPIRSAILQRDYQLFVSLPDGYREGTRSYPVLFLTDANYAFPLVRSIVRRVRDDGKALEDCIVIGLSYARGETPGYSRRRDYTPTVREQLDPAPGGPYRYGEAEAYRRFIAEEVFPWVASHYRADLQRAIYAGHSYGGLLGVHILLTEPRMFSHYILSSPSLWYDNKVMFKRLESYLASQPDLPAKVLMPIGAFETVRPESDNPRYHKEHDMVRDLLRFEQRLQERAYPGLEIRALVLDDEDHLTVFPASITRGLLWALAPKK